MTEEQLFAMLGRLYAMAQMKDNEIRRLNEKLAAYELLTRAPSDDGPDDETFEETR